MNCSNYTIVNNDPTRPDVHHCKSYLHQHSEAIDIQDASRRHLGDTAGVRGEGRGVRGRGGGEGVNQLWDLA